MSAKRPKPIGYLVVEWCEEYEKVLGLRINDKTPQGGVLDWTSGAVVMFPTKPHAVAVINRTEHYRLAFGLDSGLGALPEKKLCKIVAVTAGVTE